MKRLEPTARRQQILDGAFELATQRGFDALTRDDVAAHCNVANGQINRLFGSAEGMRIAVVQLAIDTANTGDVARVNDAVLRIIASGIIHGYACADGASEELRQRAINASYL